MFGSVISRLTQEPATGHVGGKTSPSPSALTPRRQHHTNSSSSSTSSDEMNCVLVPMNGGGKVSLFQEMLPTDLLYEIWEYLPLEGVLLSRGVCNDWNNKIGRRPLLLQRFPFPSWYVPNDSLDHLQNLVKCLKIQSNYCHGRCHASTVEKKGHASGVATHDGTVALPRWSAVGLFRRVNQHCVAQGSVLMDSNNQISMVQYEPSLGLVGMAISGTITVWNLNTESVTHTLNSVHHAHGSWYLLDIHLNQNHEADFIVQSNDLGSVVVFSLNYEAHGTPQAVVASTTDPRIRGIKFTQIGDTDGEVFIVAACIMCIHVFVINQTSLTMVSRTVVHTADPPTSIACALLRKSVFCFIGFADNQTHALYWGQTTRDTDNTFCFEPLSPGTIGTSCLALERDGLCGAIGCGSGVVCNVIEDPIAGLVGGPPDPTSSPSFVTPEGTIRYSVKALGRPHGGMVCDIWSDSDKIISVDLECTVHLYDRKTGCLKWTYSVEVQDRLALAVVRSLTEVTTPRSITVSNGTVVVSPLLGLGEALILNFDVDEDEVSQEIRKEEIRQDGVVVEMHPSHSLSLSYLGAIFGPAYISVMITITLFLFPLRYDNYVSSSWAGVFAPHFMCVPYYMYINYQYYTTSVLFRHGLIYWIRCLADVSYLALFPIAIVLRIEYAPCHHISWHVVFATVHFSVLMGICGSLAERSIADKLKVHARPPKDRNKATTMDVVIPLYISSFFLLLGIYMDDHKAISIYLVFLPVFLAIAVSLIFLRALFNRPGVSTTVSILSAVCVALTYAICVLFPVLLLCMTIENNLISVPLSLIVVPIQLLSLLFSAILVGTSMRNVFYLWEHYKNSTI
eukprot:PhF_6_TR39667/c0_g1_i1/m.58891